MRPPPPTASRTPGARANAAATCGGDAAHGRDDVDVAHDLAAPADRARDLGLAARRDARRTSATQRAGLGRARAGRARARRSPQERDALEDLLGGLVAEARQCGEASVARGGLELVQRLDAEPSWISVDLARCRARARAASRAAPRACPPAAARATRTRRSPPGRAARPAWPARARAPRRARRRARAAPMSSVSRREHRARGGLVRARLEPVLAAQLEQRRDPREDVRGGAGIHGRNIQGARDTGHGTRDTGHEPRLAPRSRLPSLASRVPCR